MKLVKVLSLVLSLSVGSAFAAEPKVGDPAPDFKLQGADGKSYSLKEMKGKVVVLEWLNYDCPFVKKHYDTGNMQKLQADETKNGAVWFSVISSAKGKQGNYPAADIVKKTAELKASPTAVLIDSDGKVGKAYGAKTTPHMYVVDREGKLSYAGAIDDKPSTDKEDVATAKNYVREAVAEIMAGKPVSIQETKSYGCGVKYL